MGVPQRLDELAHRLADRVEREAVAVPGLLGGEVVPAQGVRAVGVEHVPRHHHVAARLGHLLPLGVGDQAQAEHRLERGAAEQQRRDRQQRVEPAARLVQRLADVVGGEPLLEALAVLERRVPLRERHAAGVPPHVDQVGHPPVGAAVALEGGLVHERPVQVVGDLGPQLPQLLPRAHADGVLAVLGAPDRERRAPVALAGEGPVHVVLEPVAEPAVLDVLGVPAHRLVGGQQVVLGRGRAHVPVGLGVVDEGRLAAPAVGVGVLVLARPEQPARLAQRLDDQGIRLAHVHPGERAGAIVEGAVGAHRVVDREAVVGGQPEVVLAEGGARVHHAGAVLDRHEVAGQHGVAPLAVVGQVGKRRLVGQAQQRRAGHPIHDLRVLTQHPLHQRLGQDQRLLAEPRAHVGDLGIDRDRGVGHQRPRHRRPGQQRHARLLAQREAHVHGRVDHVLVALRHLVARQRGAAAGAVRNHLVALEEQALVPDLLQRPPDRLDVVVVQREVGLVGVDPEPDPLGQPVPLVDVAQHRLAAARVELRHAEALDVVLGLKAQLLLDLQLHGQAVAVPAPLAVHQAAAHRAVAREHVLEHAAEHVVGARAPVGRRAGPRRTRTAPRPGGGGSTRGRRRARASARGSPPRARGRTAGCLRARNGPSP